MSTRRTLFFEHPGVRARPRFRARVRPRRDRAWGLTLLELVTALAVAGVLLGIAVPSFEGIVGDVRLVGETNRWAATLRQARSEAIKRGRPVIVCARSSDTACGDDWSNGWIVYADLAAGAAGSLDAADEKLALHSGAPAGTTLAANGLVRNEGTVDRTAIGFDSRSRADWTLGTLTLCDARGAAHAHALVLGGAGNLRSAEAPGSGGPVRDAFGNAVTCS